MLKSVFFQGRTGQELQKKVENFLSAEKIKREQIVSISYAVEHSGNLILMDPQAHNCYIIYAC